MNLVEEIGSRLEWRFRPFGMNSFAGFRLYILDDARLLLHIKLWWLRDRCQARLAIAPEMFRSLGIYGRSHVITIGRGLSTRQSEPAVGRGCRNNLSPGAASTPISRIARVCQRCPWAIASAR